jgi:hypothetical protein
MSQNAVINPKNHYLLEFRDTRHCLVHPLAGVAYIGNVLTRAIKVIQIILNSIQNTEIYYTQTKYERAS